MHEHPDDCVVLPEDAGARVREALGVPATRRPRIMYVPGPGDVYGSFEQWRSGRHDERAPKLAYSTMFYALVARLDAEAAIVGQADAGVVTADPRFRFLPVPRKRRSTRGAYYRSELRHTLLLRRYVRSYRPDAVIVGSDFAEEALALLPRGPRIVLAVHNTYWAMGQRPTAARARLKQRLAARGLRRAHGAVCVSEECVRQLRALAPIPGPCLVATPQLLRGSAGCHRPRRRLEQLVYLGRIERDKGVFDLVAAFERARALRPTLRLVFAGAGTAVPELQGRIEKSPAADAMEHVGVLDAGGVRRLLETSDLLVCPTRSAFNEGLATVAVEAAAQGVPSLLSSVVPAQELLESACRTFVADSADDLAEQLLELVRDDAQLARMSEATRAVTDRLFDRSRSWGSRLYEVLASR
ncbi:MAG: glycosyltransferase family 4 protein [Pseudomonadales bacterium]|jgi:glycosyltransferase involved in cell wall biosynthesis|nr:glycosyltransferase family 4 protein [Pseudomonadales bacterium]